MRKILILVCIFVSCTALKCDNEPVDGEFLAANNCETLAQITTTAAIALSNSDEFNYMQLCSNYRLALRNQIDSCGDPEGLLQAEFLSLEDCVFDLTDLCEEAIVLANSASNDLRNASSENFSQLCLIYRTALENVILFCGDEDGSIQQTLDVLGNCEEASQYNCETVTQIADQVRDAYYTVSQANYEFLCSAYISALEAQIESCGDDDGSLQEIINTLGDCSPIGNYVRFINNGSTYFYTNLNITQNLDGSLTLTSTNPETSVKIIYNPGDIGENIISLFEIMLPNGVVYTQDFSENLPYYLDTVTANSDVQFIATFSGTFVSADRSDVLVAENGEIYVIY